MSILTKVAKPTRKQALQFILDVLASKNEDLENYDKINEELSQVVNEINKIKEELLENEFTQLSKEVREFAEQKEMDFSSNIYHFNTSRYYDFDRDREFEETAGGQFSAILTIRKQAEINEEAKATLTSLFKKGKELAIRKNKISKRERRVGDKARIVNPLEINAIAEQLPEEAIQHIDAIANLIKQTAEKLEEKK